MPEQQTVDKNTEEQDLEKLDFGCEYSDNIPQILKQLNISLAFTSYQAGRLMLLRTDGQELDINYKSFQRPMGLTASKDGITLGVFSQIINFKREDGLLAQMKEPMEAIQDDVTAPKVSDKEKQKEQLEREQDASRMEAVDERADACFITRSSHYSGMINIHDIDWGNGGLWAVNSSFSCLCTITPDYSFVPQWKPYFITELVPEDRCHLNGMTLKDGEPAYVTTFSKYNKLGAWRTGNKFDGTLMDVKENKILVDGLAMPHSPRWYNERVYFCNSAEGLVSSYIPNQQRVENIIELQGFTRGMDFYGPIMFVGLSKARLSDVTSPAPIGKKYDQTFCGIWLINLETNEEIGYIKFTGDVEQIYDIAVLQGTSFPELLEPSHPRMRNHFTHPSF